MGPLFTCEVVVHVGEADAPLAWELISELPDHLAHMAGPVIPEVYGVEAYAIFVLMHNRGGMLACVDQIHNYLTEKKLPHACVAVCPDTELFVLDTSAE